MYHTVHIPKIRARGLPAANFPRWPWATPHGVAVWGRAIHPGMYATAAFPPRPPPASRAFSMVRVDWLRRLARPEQASAGPTAHRRTRA